MPTNILKRLSQALQGKTAEPVVSGSSSSPPRETPGKAIKVGSLINGRFQLQAEIGRGGMGIVYLAKDLPNNRDAAVKVINREQVNPLSRGQFSREAQIITQLNHPHIVSIYEVGDLDEGRRERTPYIAMEYVHGTSLDNLHNLTFARIVDLGKQICEALEHAHKQGFIHHDLKPGNVLVEKRGFQYFAKLVDFGLALPRGITNLTPGNNLAGTIFYLAPEVIAGRPADVASDLYALGAMLYEMVTGRVPFSDFFDDQAILNQHLVETASPPSHSRADVPPALEAIIVRLLEKNPGDRFESAQEVYKALDQVPFAKNQGNLQPASADSGLDEEQLVRYCQMLQDHSLVTLVGEHGNPGPAVGWRLMNEFSNGIWLIDLETVHDPSRVINLFADALGVMEIKDRGLAITLIEYLHEKNLLLILDHCDRVVPACSQLIRTILECCPDVRILATSCKPLYAQGEYCYQAFSSANTSPEPH